MLEISVITVILHIGHVSITINGYCINCAVYCRAVRMAVVGTPGRGGGGGGGKESAVDFQVLSPEGTGRLDCCCHGSFDFPSNSFASR